MTVPLRWEIMVKVYNIEYGVYRRKNQPDSLGNLADFFGSTRIFPPRKIQGAEVAKIRLFC